MYKNILGLVILVSTPFLPSLSFAQELPNSSLLVNTQCKISHGHSIDDVIAVARAIPSLKEALIEFFTEPQFQVQILVMIGFLDQSIGTT